MVKMRFDFKKNEKIIKAFSVICIGIIAMLVFSKNNNSNSLVKGENNTMDASYSDMEEYEEKRITNILNEAYGEGTCKVTVKIKEETNQSFYEERRSYEVSAVCVVTTLNNEKMKADIIYSISSLYSLPTHKVTIMQKKN